MPEKVLSVAEFNTVVDQVLKTGVGQMTVKGEVSEFKVSQGKFAYFNIKDANSVLNCFAMAFKLDFPLEDGQEVAVTGKPGIHLKSGRYSLTVDSVRLHGEGSLQKAFEELKKKLATEGLFDEVHKRPLPRFPESIGIITSGEGAAVNDIVKVIDGRWGGLKLYLLPAAVQGKNAVDELVAAIDYFNQYHPVDVILFGRGGGSLEDLQAFNAERVARSIFASRIPIVSGVGHEHNTSISDFVADVRAATPSNAAEIAVPDRREIAREISHYRNQNHQIVARKIEVARRHVTQSQHSLQLFIGQQVAAIRTLIARLEQSFNSKQACIPTERRQLASTQTQLTRFVDNKQNQSKQRLHEYLRVLRALNPTGILSRGYSITYAANTNTVVASVADLPSDGRMRTQLADGTIESVIGQQPDKKTPSISQPRKRDTLPHETRQTTLI